MIISIHGLQHDGQARADSGGADKATVAEIGVAALGDVGGEGVDGEVEHVQDVEGVEVSAHEELDPGRAGGEAVDDALFALAGGKGEGEGAWGEVAGWGVSEGVGGMGRRGGGTYVPARWAGALLQWGDLRRGKGEGGSIGGGRARARWWIKRRGREGWGRSMVGCGRGGRVVSRDEGVGVCWYNERSGLAVDVDFPFSFS